MTQLVKGIHLPMNDTHFAEHLHKGPLWQGRGTYQFNKIRAFWPYVKRWGVALDVGAHVGLWTFVLADKFKMVHAFEPVPDHTACWRKNLQGYKNVRLHETALGEIDGMTRIMLTAENSGNAYVGGNGVGQKDASFLSVPITQLDVWAKTIDQPIDFLKIDVEGFEKMVISGGRETIQRCKPVMVVEQKPGHAERQGIKTGEAIKLLERWGAKVAWVKSGDYCMIW